MTCKYPTCTNPVGQQDRDDYRAGSFCSVEHEVKYEHVAADARDAQIAEQERLEESER